MQPDVIRTAGVHHVTAIATDARRTLEFYAGLLGLRLVKKTVNFDDPGTYHLYFGDRPGRPGTILTFFPWAHARRGAAGPGQTTATSLEVAAASLGYWQERLAAAGITTEGGSRFGRDFLTFRDPDGLALELVGGENVDRGTVWTGGGVPAAHAIGGVHGVTLTERSFDPTAALLRNHLGFVAAGEQGGRFRFEAPGGAYGRFVDLVLDSSGPPGLVAAGTVHHVAWRTDDDEGQRRFREQLADAGVRVTPVIDRQYFRSIYFREPGGALFEIATDPPGFTRDEPEGELGTGLKLPPWYESRRDQIESGLPSLMDPPGTTAGSDRRRGHP